MDIQLLQKNQALVIKLDPALFMAAVIYAYAFLALRDPWPDLDIEGIEGNIEIIAAEGLGAAVERDVDLEALQASDQTLLKGALRHDGVICQLFAQGSLIPLRFGTGFVSVETLQQHLQEQAQVYHQALAQLEGRAEYLIKVFAPPDTVVDPAPASTGTAYLLARRQAFQQQQAQVQRRQQALAELKALCPSVWPQRPLDPQAEECWRLALLLDPCQYQEAMAISQAWLADYADWQLDWSMPLPPYHFVDQVLAAES